MIKVGKAVGLDVFYDNGVYFTIQRFPWTNRSQPSSPFTHKIAIGGGQHLYVDPKNKGIIPFEHQWTEVDQAIMTTDLSRAKKTWKDLYLKSMLTKDNKINIPSKEVADEIKKTEAGAKAPAKVPAWVKWVAGAVVLILVWKYFKGPAKSRKR